MSKDHLVRWSGFSLVVAGGLVALAVLVHPSRETAQSILAQEWRLEAGHWLLTLFCAFFLLGLPGVYASRAASFGRLGLAGFVLLIFGTLFFAVSDDYGFVAPVLARMAPQTLDAVNAYPSNAAMDGLFVLLLTVGFVLFGAAIRRVPGLPGPSGVMFAAGWPMFMVGSGLALTVFEPLYLVAVLGAGLMGAGIAWVGYAVWAADAPGPVRHGSGRTVA